MTGQPDVHAALRVVLAATRALLAPEAGLNGRTRELAESAGRNAERLARLLDSSDRPVPARGLVDVGAALGIERGDDGAEPLWAIVDMDELRRGVDGLTQAARSTEAVTVRPGTDGKVEVVVTLPGLMSPLPAERAAGWKPLRV